MKIEEYAKQKEVSVDNVVKMMNRLGLTTNEEGLSEDTVASLNQEFRKQDYLNRLEALHSYIPQELIDRQKELIEKISKDKNSCEKMIAQLENKLKTHKYDQYNEQENLELRTLIRTYKTQMSTLDVLASTISGNRESISLDEELIEEEKERQAELQNVIDTFSVELREEGISDERVSEIRALIEDSRSSITDSKNTVSSLQERIDTLNKSLEDASREHERVKDKAKNLRAEIDEFPDRLRQRDEKELASQKRILESINNNGKYLLYNPDEKLKTIIAQYEKGFLKESELKESLIEFKNNFYTTYATELDDQFENQKRLSEIKERREAINLEIIELQTFIDERRANEKYMSDSAFVEEYLDSRVSNSKRDIEEEIDDAKKSIENNEEYRVLLDKNIADVDKEIRQVKKEIEKAIAQKDSETNINALNNRLEKLNEHKAYYQEFAVLLVNEKKEKEACITEKSEQLSKLNSRERDVVLGALGIKELTSTSVKREEEIAFKQGQINSLKSELSRLDREEQLASVVFGNELDELINDIEEEKENKKVIPVPIVEKEEDKKKDEEVVVAPLVDENVDEKEDEKEDEVVVAPIEEEEEKEDKLIPIVAFKESKLGKSIANIKGKALDWIREHKKVIAAVLAGGIMITALVSNFGACSMLDHTGDEAKLNHDIFVVHDSPYNGCNCNMQTVDDIDDVVHFNSPVADHSSSYTPSGSTHVNPQTPDTSIGNPTVDDTSISDRGEMSPGDNLDTGEKPGLVPDDDTNNNNDDNDKDNDKDEPTPERDMWHAHLGTAADAGTDQAIDETLETVDDNGNVQTVHPNDTQNDVPSDLVSSGDGNFETPKDRDDNVAKTPSAPQEETPQEKLDDIEKDLNLGGMSDDDLDKLVQQQSASTISQDNAQQINDLNELKSQIVQSTENSMESGMTR